MAVVIEFLSRGWVGNTIGLAGLILALVSIWLAYHFYRRSRQGAQIAYHHKTIRVLGAKGHTLPEAVKITFRDRPIENLCRSLVLVWNNSDKTIYGKNIVESDPLRIDMGEGVKVLDDRIVKITREVNNYELGAIVHFQEEVEAFMQPVIRFDYLDSGDGCVVEIFHTDGGQLPILRGSIHEMPRGFKNYKQLFPLRSHAYLASFFGFFGVILIGGAIFRLNLEGTLDGGAMWLVMGCLCSVFAAGIAIRHRRRYPKALSMPEFSSN